VVADLASEVKNAKDRVEAANDKVEEHGRRAAKTPWIEGLARLGYITRGVLYITVGLLAVGVALGLGGTPTDKEGAIAAIGAHAPGKILLIIIAVGLAGYALWGFIRALLDPLGRGAGLKGLAQRAGYVISGLTYGGLVLPTVRLLLGNGTSNGDEVKEGTATVLAAPFGPWLVGLAGAIAMIGGLGQFYEAYSAKFKKEFKTHQMKEQELTWATRIGRFGYAARGVVFVLGGFFLVQAALNVDPNRARGLDGALWTLAHQPYGPVLLGAVALGLVSFGIYSILCARWIQVVRDEE
jgi:hypothetical protein